MEIIEIDHSQPMGEINFSKFAISYKQDAIVKTPIKEESHSDDPILQPQALEEKPKIRLPEPEERKCCCHLL